ncbi:nicotinamide riboside kinase 1 [Podospora appendiculata]|uniref:Nicotinamide riboside kinase 1 n=1 Tax=Podospora appendiculata TaxID=314037 RepID=A0AAE0WYM7_9PEZI|nr:nicotinamide riboside kinase 1 [Podospora appendiculata]KAK3684276.1 nicotinamide riboside kinase 1 [Podospora appendiculata]
MDKQKAIVIGISGCSSSGKTTLARILRDIFPNTFILHEDDFYKAEDELPMKNGLVDWDCPEAISMPDMEAALTHIRTTGEFPPTLTSKEDQNSIGPSPLSPSLLQTLKTRIAAWLQPPQAGSFLPPSSLKLCLLDGFLLYNPTHTARIMAQLDIKLFLLASRAKATARREARDGYVTLEGFWTDPPGYVDQVVWPNYVESHAWLFEGGVVDGGRLDEAVLREWGIQAQVGKGEDVDFDETVEWAVGRVMEGLEAFATKERGGLSNFRGKED